LELPVNAQQLMRDSLQWLQDNERWIENEVILAYFKEIVLAHRRLETLFVSLENCIRWQFDKLAARGRSNQFADSTSISCWLAICADTNLEQSLLVTCSYILTKWHCSSIRHKTRRLFE
jgi:hypothetical protein